MHQCQCVWATQKTQPEKGARCFIKGVWATVRIVQLMTMCNTGIDKQATNRVTRVGVEGLQKKKRVEARFAVHFHTCELEARAQDQKLASARHTQHGNVEGVRQTPQTSFRGKPKLRNSGGGYRIGMIGLELHTTELFNSGSVLCLNSCVGLYTDRTFSV